MCWEVLGLMMRTRTGTSEGEVMVAGSCIRRRDQTITELLSPSLWYGLQLKQGQIIAPGLSFVTHRDPTRG